MVVKIVNDKLEVKDEKNTLKQNLDKIEQLNNNTFFKHKFTNKIGRELVYFLCNSVHYNLSNPEPVNLSKNTLSKSLSILKVIDKSVNKPLNEYEFKVMNEFISNFVNGNIQSRGNKTINPKTISFYIGEFKRFWKIYRQYELHHNKNFKEIFFDWGTNLKAPKVKREFESVPDLSIKQVLELSENLLNEEYKVRTLVAVNLMGRRCEIENLQLNHLEFKDDGSIFIKLPHIKKHSTEKTRVELFSFVRKELNKYLQHNNFNSEQLIFPSRVEAYAKNLRQVSEKLLKKRINPKTLRKIGLSVCDELGYSRSDTERIGGWQANSPVVAHYFNRTKSVFSKDKNKKINKELYEDVYSEFDKVKLENDKLKEEMASIKDMLKSMIKSGEFAHLKSV